MSKWNNKKKKKLNRVLVLLAIAEWPEGLFSNF